MILYLLFAHFVADFVMQTHSMAINKSHSLLWLTAHVLAYTTIMGLFSIALFSEPTTWFWFVSITGVLHFAIDFITSKINKWLWELGQVHNFFVGVGADQYLHYVCLIGLYRLLVGSIY